MKKALLIILVLVIGIISIGLYLNYQKQEADYVKFTGKTWFDYGIGQYIPTMKLRSGQTPKARDLITNSDSSMFFQIQNASKEDDFTDYVKLLMDSGFVNDVERTFREYKATDGDNHRVRVYNWGNGTITVEASIPE